MFLQWSLVQYVQLPENGGWLLQKSRAPVQTLENLEMKKTLVAIAALSAMSAFAQSSVTMYGVIDAGYISTKSEATNTTTWENSAIQGGTASSSRLGFKGTEDLGGGLAANFVAEAALGALAGGSNNSFLSNSATSGNRQTFVSVGGAKTGTVAAGYMYTANHSIRAALDPFGGSNMPGNISIGAGVAGTVNSASAATTATSAFGAGNNNDYDYRATAIAYAFPQFVKGLDVGVGFVRNQKTLDTSGTETQPTGKANATSISAAYAAGPLTLMGATSEKTAITATANSIPAANGTLLTAGVDGDATKQWKLKNTTVGAKYAMGATSLTALMYSDKKTYDTPATGLNDVNNRGTMVGVKHSIGQTDLLASYSKGKYQTGVATATTNLDRAQSGYLVGVTYNFSKRTNAYAMMGSQKREAAVATERNLTDKATAFGIRHSF
jgi:predicted porin